MHKNYLSLIAVFATVSPLVGCPFFTTGSGTDATAQASITHQERDFSSNLALALGGGRDSSDLISISQDLKFLDFGTNDGDLFNLEIPSGQNSFTEAKGVRIVPKKEGIGYVVPKIDGRDFPAIQVTIPPQELIQILIGEARTELGEEATLDDQGDVKSTSVSVTGDAVGSVIRNRVSLITDLGKPELFKADPVLFAANVPFSSYEAVIEGTNGTIYQFSPLSPNDSSHEEFLESANRGKLRKALIHAYDQAVLTAAGILNGETKDPTKGAFGFYSPTQEQFQLLQNALDSETDQLPDGCGASDKNFPELTPIQVLILPSVAPSSTVTGAPSFVFIRSRGHPKDPAVVTKP